MEKQLPHEEFECVICTEIPIEVKETKGCGALICGKCGPKLKKCPNRGQSDKFELQFNKFVQRMVNQIPVPGDFGGTEYSRRTVLGHSQIGEKNLLKAVVFNEALHPGALYKQVKNNDWNGDSLKMVKQECAKSGKEVVDYHGGVSWFGSTGDVDFCDKCIEKYGNVKDKEELRMYPPLNKHLTHTHKLKLLHGAKLPKQALENCYGKYRKGGCPTMAEPSVRYFVCFDCRVLLCESCFEAPSEDFIELISPEFHEHPLHLSTHTPAEAWECGVNSVDCLKPEKMSNITQKVSYKGDVGNLDAGVKGAKSQRLPL